VKQVWQDRPIFVSDSSPEREIVVRVAGQDIPVEQTLQHMPSSLLGATRHVDVPNDRKGLDLSVVRLPHACTTAAVYTRNLCVSPAIHFDRKNTQRGLIELVCVISKNASVFTPNGAQDIEQIGDALAKEFQIEKSHVLISCTGVIGRSLPTPHVVNSITGLSKDLHAEGLAAVSQAILTTDKRPKCASIRIGDLVIGGYAKGAGMIEPNMATMLVYLYTNAAIAKSELDVALKEAVDPTFNCMSVDSDTSTSDTVALMATGKVVCDSALFKLALTAVCLRLARAVAREAEGANKLIEVTVQMGTSQQDAHFFAKKIINSPLIKTAIHGADPNWGRIVMAIGKPTPGSPLLSIEREDVVIRIQGTTMFERGERVEADLVALSNNIRASENVRIEVVIGTPVYSATVWGCDLSAEYVRENADYTS
jgi:glutamate N-acetyltransferase / amino-acid N-acetyltransferase